MSAFYEMRAPCQWCGDASRRGTLATVNGQNVVRCAVCERACYNAPKRETGERPFVLTERTGIRPSVRARIMRECGYRCVFCGADGTVEGGLHLAHLIDRQDAARYGLLDELIDDPVNLTVACAECNLGAASLGTLPISLIVRALLVMHRKQRGETGG